MASYNPSIERLTRDELLGLQAQRLRYQVGYLWESNPFYRERWQQAGVAVDDVRSAADIVRLPLVRKQDFLADQQADPPYGRRLGVPRDRLVLTHITSGTSGQGQEAYGVTAADLEYGGHCWAYGLTWAGVRRGDVAFNLFPFATYAAGTSAHQGMQILGCNTFSVAVLYDTRTVLERLRRFDAAFLLTTPPYLQTLTATAREMGLDTRTDFPALRAIMLATAAYGVQWAADMQDLWGVTLHEMYGSSQQLTHLGSTCDRGALPGGRRGVLHCLEHYTVVEVVDPESGEHVAPGEIGELVISTLTREASPAVRFATGDSVTYLPAGACDCGLPFAGLEAGTISRYDDMLKIKGVNVWPQAIDEVVLSHADVEEYRGRVFIGPGGRERAEVSVQFRSDVADGRCEALCAEFVELLRRRTTLHFGVVRHGGSYERFAFKARRWTDERQAGLDVKTL